MSGQQIGTVVGGVVGFFAGGNVQLGMAIGGLIGGAIDPAKTYGPHVGDGQAQSATDGSPISWVMGTMWVAGTIVDVGKRQEFKVKDKSQGKGGGAQSYHYEAHQNFSILVCESDAIKGSTIKSVLMVEQDGKIVYDVRPGSTMLADSQKWLARNCIFYYGDEAQLPTAADEAAHGVGNAPAYRGVLRAFFTQFNVTAAGDRIPSFRFLVSVSPGAFISNVSFNSSGYADSTGRTWTLTQGTITDRWGLQPVTSPIFSDGSMRIVPDTKNHDGTFDYLNAAPNVGIGTSLDASLGLTDFDITITARPNVNSDQYNVSSSFLCIYFTSGRLTLGARFSTTCKVENTVAPGRFTYTKLADLTLTPGKIATFRVTLVGDVMTTYCNGVAYAQYVHSGAANPATYIIVGNGDGNLSDTFGWYGDIQSFVMTGAVSDAPAQLADVVSTICRRGGLDIAQTELSALSGKNMLGYAIAKQMNAVNALGPLLGAYFAYASEYDGKINFDFYGKDAVMTIDEADLLEANDANGNAVTANLRNNATEFPRRIIGQYYDPAQNYMPVTVMQTRRASGITATGDRSFDIPVVMTADQAQQTVDKALKVAYAQLEGTLEFSVPFAGASNVYLSLVPGDAVLFRGKRSIVANTIISTGYIKLTLQYDRQGAYTSAVQAIAGLTPTPPLSRYSGPTTLIPMNLPALQTGDAYGLYLVAGPVAATQNWQGCDVQMSLDSGATWQSVTQIRAASTFGALTAADTGTTLVAQVNDDLESVGSAQLDAQQNAAALLHGTAAEVLQFGTATEDATTAHLYTLTTLRRHLLGTTQIAGAVDDKFVMLDNVVLLPIDLAFAGKTIKLRGVGFGEDADSATVVSIVYSPDTAVIIDGGKPGDGLPKPT